MVALTPNRAYPYATPTDPADVPARLEAFAKAVDQDLSVLEPSARPRHMAQFFGNVMNTIPGTATSGTLTWQLTDFNTVSRTGPMLGGQDVLAVQPVTSATTTQLRVNVPGFWLVTTSVQVGTAIPSAGIDLIGIEIIKNATVVNTNTASLTHDTEFVNDTTHTLDASTGLVLAAGDTVAVRGRVGRSSGFASVRFFNRSITLLRMTQS